MFTATLITGVSSGIGLGLARYLLRQGGQVYGLSRRCPAELERYSGFQFRALDLRDQDVISDTLASLLDAANELDLVILNAGILGRFGDLAETPLDDLLNTMHVNVWGNKPLLDWLFGRGMPIGQVVAISSGASVNGNRGWGGYSLSKAALNMLMQLYAREQPGTHFLSLAPGLVDTAMQDELAAVPRDERFPALEVLAAKRHTPEMPGADEAAPRLLAAIRHAPNLLESGAFADIRNPPLNELEH